MLNAFYFVLKGNYYLAWLFHFKGQGVNYNHDYELVTSLGDTLNFRSQHDIFQYWQALQLSIFWWIQNIWLGLQKGGYRAKIMVHDFSCVMMKFLVHVCTTRKREPYKTFCRNRTPYRVPYFIKSLYTCEFITLKSDIIWPFWVI